MQITTIRLHSTNFCHRNDSIEVEYKSLIWFTLFVEIVDNYT